jgi:hypothetical protein
MYPSVVLKVADDCRAGDLFSFKSRPIWYL